MPEAEISTGDSRHSFNLSTGDQHPSGAGTNGDERVRMKEAEPGVLHLRKLTDGELALPLIWYMWCLQDAVHGRI